jgi:DNA-binding NtrC family response regulator
MLTNKHTKSKNTKILIVDDEEDLAKLFKIGLERSGFEVTVYNDPLSALHQYKPGYYDLLLLDVRMPGLNGFELYQKIIELEPSVKVCFITAYEEYYDGSKRNTNQIVYDCFIKKPISIVDLIYKVKMKING